MMLPQVFLDRPLAHRALHDKLSGRVENSLSAVQAAVAHGYGIEIDVQLTSDGEAMVFHDELLDRLTGETGYLRRHTRRALERVSFRDGAGCIPSLETVLEAVGGRVPVLIEVKDQDGAMGDAVGPLEEAVARELDRYRGPVAVMSFNPHSVAKLAHLCPEVPRGLTTSSYQGMFWPEVPEPVRDRLREIPDYDAVGACFISHEVTDLDRPRVAEIKAQGGRILCWTVRSARQERKAREVAENITFEGYAA